MKLLLAVKKYFRILGISPQGDLQSSLLNVKNMFAISLMILATIQVAVYGLTEAKSATEYGFSFYVFCTTSLQSLNVFINALKIRKIYQLIENFEGFINNRLKNTASEKIYRESNELVEKLCEIIHFTLIKITLPALILPLVCISSINYLVFDSKEDSFYLPIPIAFPFDWKTPFGYLIALLIESTIAYYLCAFSVGTVCSIFGCSWTLTSIIEDIVNDLCQFNLSETSNENQRLVKVSFRQVIEINSQARQLTTESNELYMIDITDAFLWSLATIASGLLVLESELSKGADNPIKLITPLCFVFWSVAWTAFFCELGQMVTNRFKMFNDELWQCNWFSFPIRTQRMLVTVLANTQQPVIVRGYAGALCSREAVKQTINKGFSYFTMLNRLDQ